MENNQTIKNQLSRTSVRSYTNKPITKEIIDTLKAAINNAPTSMNNQCFSAIFVTDNKVKELYKKANWGQEHLVSCPLLIVFLADYNRINWAFKKEGATPHKYDFEDFTIATVDAAIAATYASDAANSLGLGTCFIGGIRLFADLIKETLKLEGNLTPIVGLTVGYPNKIENHKPKVNKCYDETYNLTKVESELDQYNEIFAEYIKDNFGKDSNFSRNVARSFGKMDHSKRNQWLKEQFIKE